MGALIGWTSVSNSASAEGPTGDIAGAAGVLMILICIVATFVMGMLTVIAGKVLHRGEPRHFALRFAATILGGIVIGILGPNNTTLSTIASWFLLLVLPILLVWFWRGEIGAPKAN